MSRHNLSKNLRHLPKFGAMALGVGGLFVGDAAAHKSDIQTSAGPTRQRDLAIDQVVMLLSGNRIYFSQRGGPFKELLLGDTQQATYLRNLLRDAGAEDHPVSVPIGSIVVANGGGAGDAKKPVAEDTKPKEPATGTASQKKQPDQKAKQPPNPTNGK